MKLMTLVVLTLLCLAATFVPMHYRTYSYLYDNAILPGLFHQMELKYGFEGRRGCFGEWHRIGSGADSIEEANRWIKQQPIF